MRSTKTPSHESEVNRNRVVLGRPVATPGAAEFLTMLDFAEALGRHAAGDWGDICREDWAANEKALATSGRVLSAFYAEDGTKFWVITDADRSVTTVLLPEEY